ncbi:MAG: peptide ABC transporter substrate-binding protein [Ktedonobacteraceae bacterium]|nr:peptide ABC transporter substrate-binding protein [Ktedonobacteraceae bacterium]
MHWLMRPVQALALGLLCGALALSACGGGNTAGTPARAARQVLTLPNVGTTDLATLDPAQGEDANSQIVFSLLYSGLVRVDKDLHVVPDQATWSISPDKKVYTFTLRPHVRFADGTEVTASTYVYNWTRILRPETAAAQAPLLMRDIAGADEVAAGKAQTLSGVKAVSEQVLQVTLKQPAPYFLAELANPLFFPLNQAVIGQDGAKDWVGRVAGSGVGTGPFLLKQWERNIRMVFVPNPYYYGSKTALTEVDMFFVSDATTAFKTYRANQGDLVWGLAPEDQVLVKKSPDFVRKVLLQTSALFFDTTKPPFNNVAVRKAFAYATDRVGLVHSQFDDSVEVAKTILPPGMAGYQPDYAGLPFDKKMARSVLQSAYPDLANLPQITFAYPSSQMTPDMASALQRMWQSTLNVQVTVRPVEETAYGDAIARHEVQLGLVQWTADFVDPYDFLVMHLLSSAGGNGGYWSNRDFEHAIGLAESHAGEERIGLYQQAERIAIEDVGWLPLYHQMMAAIIPAWVHGVTVNGNGLYFGDWSDVYLNQKGTG